MEITTITITAAIFAIVAILMTLDRCERLAHKIGAKRHDAMTAVSGTSNWALSFNPENIFWSDAFNLAYRFPRVPGAKFVFNVSATALNL